MPSAEWVRTWGPLIAPAVTGLLGAWAGAKLALRRFKDERAHEHRVNWYRETLRVVNQARSSYSFGATFTRRGDNTRAKEELEKAWNATVDALRHTHEARLFGTPSTVRALKRLNDEDLQSLTGPDEKTPDAVADSLEEIEELFKEVGRVIAEDGRAVMGSEELDL